MGNRKFLGTDGSCHEMATSLLNSPGPWDKVSHLTCLTGMNAGCANSPNGSRDGLREQGLAQAGLELEATLTVPVPGNAPLNCLIYWY